MGKKNKKNHSVSTTIKSYESTTIDIVARDSRDYWIKIDLAKRRDLLHVDKTSVLRQIKSYSNYMNTPSSSKVSLANMNNKNACMCAACRKRKLLYDAIVKVFEDCIHELEEGKRFRNNHCEIKKLSKSSGEISEEKIELTEELIEKLQQLPFESYLIMENDKIIVSDSGLKENSGKFFDMLNCFVENESLIKKSVIKKAQNALNELEKKHQEMRKQKMVKQQNTLEKKHSKEDEKEVSSGEEEGVYLSDNETSSTSYESYDSSDDSEHEPESHSHHNAIIPSNAVAPVPAPANALSTTTTTTTSTVSSNHENLETKTIVSKTVKKVEVISKEKEMIACKGEVKTETTTTITKTTTKASGTKITSTTTKTTKTGNSNELSYEQQKQCVENIINSQNIESRFLFLIFIARLFAHNIKMAFEDMISLINQTKLLMECEQEKQALAKKKNSKVDKKKKKVVVEESDDEDEEEDVKPAPISITPTISTSKKSSSLVEIESESLEDEEEDVVYNHGNVAKDYTEDVDEDWNVVDYKKFKTKGRGHFTTESQNNSTSNSNLNNNTFVDRRKTALNYSSSPQNKRGVAPTVKPANFSNNTAGSTNASKLEPSIEPKKVSPRNIPQSKSPTLQQSASVESISPRVENNTVAPTQMVSNTVPVNLPQQPQVSNNSKVVGFEYLQQNSYSPFGSNTAFAPTLGFPNMLPPSPFFSGLPGFGDSSYYQNPFNLPTIFNPNPEGLGYVGFPFVQPQPWGMQPPQQQAFGPNSHQ